MIAFRDVKAEMREACVAVSQPHSDRSPEIARMTRGKTPRHDQDDEPDAAIDAWMQEAFEALVTAYVTQEPFMLLPCTVNGERTAAIVHVSHTDRRRRRTHVTPLFVAMTPGMVLIDDKGRRAGSVGDSDDGDDEGSSSNGTTADAPAPR